MLSPFELNYSLFKPDEKRSPSGVRLSSGELSNCADAPNGRAKINKIAGSGMYHGQERYFVLFTERVEINGASVIGRQEATITEAINLASQKDPTGCWVIEGVWDKDEDYGPCSAQDCVLSDWSDWSEWTSCANGERTRTRTRTVVTDASCGGSCTDALTETDTQTCSMEQEDDSTTDATTDTTTDSGSGTITGGTTGGSDGGESEGEGFLDTLMQYKWWLIGGAAVIGLGPTLVGMAEREIKQQIN